MAPKFLFMKQYLFAACFMACAMASCTTNETKKDEATVTTDTSASTGTDTNASTSTAVTAMPDSATMMKNWQAYATPGDMHKMMSSWSGTWDAEVSSWYTPGMPPEKSKATAVNTSIMDGRYHRSVHKGSMMGMPFNGESIMGYDNAKKKFISTWVDNMGTGIMMMEGTWDSTSKKIMMSGQCIDPSAGTDKMMTMKEVFSIIDDKTQMLEMYGPGPDGKEYKLMEIKLTKR
jgi:hypothetical protein